MLQIKRVRCLVYLLLPTYCCLPGGLSLHDLRARAELHCALWGVLLPPPPLAPPVCEGGEGAFRWSESELLRRA